MTEVEQAQVAERLYELMARVQRLRSELLEAADALQAELAKVTTVPPDGSEGTRAA